LATEVTPHKKLSNRRAKAGEKPAIRYLIDITEITELIDEGAAKPGQRGCRYFLQFVKSPGEMRVTCAGHPVNL
jgi:hypothetical protein